jgi:hypothetical protein
MYPKLCPRESKNIQLQLTQAKMEAFSRLRHKHFFSNILKPRKSLAQHHFQARRVTLEQTLFFKLLKLQIPDLSIQEHRFLINGHSLL